MTDNIGITRKTGEMELFLFCALITPFLLLLGRARMKKHLKEDKMNIYMLGIRILFFGIIVHLFAFVEAFAIRLVPGSGEDGKTEIYVDAGNTNQHQDGTVANPFSTITAAKERVKTNKDLYPSKDIVVWIHSGIYQSETPLYFDPSDSGNPGQRIYYKAYPGGRPTITGEQHIVGWVDSNERVNGHAIYRASFSGDLFRKLDFGGSRGFRSREPDFDPSPLAIDDKGQPLPNMNDWRCKTKELNIQNADTTIFKDDESWHADKSEIHMPLDENKLILRIRAYQRSPDSSITTLLLRKCPLGENCEEERSFYAHCSDDDRHEDYGANGYVEGFATDRIDAQQGRRNRLWFEGAKRFLDTPGEFWVDEDTKTVWAIPPIGVTLNDLNRPGFVNAPNKADALVIILGNRNESVSNLTFDGLRLSQTNFHSVLITPSNDYEAYRVLAGEVSLPNLHVPGYNPNTTGFTLRFPGESLEIAVQSDGTKKLNRYKVPASMFIAFCDTLTVHDILFESLSGQGLHIGYGARNVDIIGNAFSDVDGTAIVALSETNGNVSWANPDQEQGLTIEALTINNNIIAGTGVALGGSGIRVAEHWHKDIAIENNYIARVPGYGISGFIGENLNINRNRIVDAMTFAKDSGAIWIGGHALGVRNNRPSGKKPTIYGNSLETVPGRDNIRAIVEENFVSGIWQPLWHTSCGPQAAFYLDRAENLDLLNNYTINYHMDSYPTECKEPLGNKGLYAIYSVCVHGNSQLKGNYVHHAGLDESLEGVVENEVCDRMRPCDGERPNCDRSDGAPSDCDLYEKSFCSGDEPVDDGDNGFFPRWNPPLSYDEITNNINGADDSAVAYVADKDVSGPSICYRCGHKRFLLAADVPTTEQCLAVQDSCQNIIK